MVRKWSFVLVACLLFVATTSFAQPSARYSSALLADDLFLIQDQYDQFVFRSLVNHTCCINGGLIGDRLYRTAFDAQLLLDAYEYELAKEFRIGFKERHGIWTPFYTHIFSFGWTLRAESRYIAQPRFSLSLPGQEAPIISLKPLSKTPFELYIEFEDLPFIE